MDSTSVVQKNPRPPLKRSVSDISRRYSIREVGKNISAPFARSSGTPSTKASSRHSKRLLESSWSSLWPAAVRAVLCCNNTVVVPFQTSVWVCGVLGGEVLISFDRMIGVPDDVQDARWDGLPRSLDQSVLPEGVSGGGETAFR